MRRSLKFDTCKFSGVDLSDRAELTDAELVWFELLSLSGPAEFKKLLLEHPEPIARCITEKLVTYATGQPVGFDDYQVVNTILEQTKASDYGLRSIVHAVIASELFQRK